MNIYYYIKQRIPLRFKESLRPFYLPFYKLISYVKGKFCVIEAKILSSKAIYYCPCCNNDLLSFIDGKYNKKSFYFNTERYKNTIQNVQCPVCGSIPRHRILAMWLEEHKHQLKDTDILYFAQEKGVASLLKRNHINFTTADLYASADLKLNIESTGLQDSSWDWIICNHVLEHVDNYKSALHEIYRILKPGGKLIISFPILSFLPTVIEEHDLPDNETEEERKARRLEKFGQVDHLRIFGIDSKEMLLQVGFKVDIIDGRKMSKLIMPVVGPADYDVNYLFLCEKPDYI